MTKRTPPAAKAQHALDEAAEQCVAGAPASWFTQRGWRRVGACCLTASALMAFFGADAEFLQGAAWILLAYWGGFLLLLGIAFYTVVLDVRYIRLQYALGRREVFRQTLGSPEFREALREAQQHLPERTNGRAKPPAKGE